MFQNLREILSNIDAIRPDYIERIPPPPSLPQPAPTDLRTKIQQFLDSATSSDDDSDIDDTTRSRGEHDIENGRCLHSLSINE